MAIARFIHGVLSQPEPWAVIVVDCKGGELRSTAEDLTLRQPGLCGVRLDRPGELPTATIAQVYQNQPDTTLAGRAWCWLRKRRGHIEVARQRRGWSITQLAGAADVSIATASRACAGRPISVETVWKLATAFQRFPANDAIERLLQGQA